MISKMSDIVDKINRILSVGLEPLNPPERISGSEYADKYYYLSEESSGNPGKWVSYPYQIAILDWMSDNRIPQFNIIKPRRIGYTEMLKSTTCKYIDIENANIAFWQPTDRDAIDFTIDSVDPMLRDVERVGDKLMSKPGIRSKFNTTAKKVFKGCILDIKGGTSPANFRRMTKQVAIYDECDGFPPDIGGEGNCFKLGDGRVDDAAYPKSIRGSTPALKELSLIEPAVDGSDVVMYRFVKCPHCGHMFPLLRKDFKYEECAFPCTGCGTFCYYKDYPRMDKYGQWRTLDGSVRYDEKNKYFTNADGERIPTPEKVGVKIWCVYSYLKSWKFFKEEWDGAMAEVRRGNMSLLKAVVNTLCGETWVEQVESKSYKAVKSLVESYNVTDSIPNGIKVITIGCDVQGDRLELEILGHGAKDEKWSLDYVILPGDVIKGDVFKKLDEQYMRTFTREDGTVLRVSVMFIDAGYQTTKIYRYTRPRQRSRIYSVMGTDTGTIPNKVVLKGEGTRKTKLYTSNSAEAKRLIFKMLSVSEPGPGFCHFPDFYKDDYFKGLTNAVMYRKIRGGVFKGYGWKKKYENSPDEPLDCRHYAIAAFNSLNLDI